jgi:phage repressor protein C with HTH and peptisase S24 domain
MTKNPVKVAKELSGLKGEQLAERIGISAGYLSRLGSSKRAIKTDLIDKLAEVSGLTTADFYLHLSDEENAPKPTKLSDSAKVAALLQPATIPLFGDLNGMVDYIEAPIDHLDMIEAPRRLTETEGAYAIRMPGTSMEPRYHEGETLFVAPHTARPGEYVVIQHSLETGEPVWQVARYERVAGASRVFSRYNGSDLTIPNERIRAIHKIIATGEW